MKEKILGFQFLVFLFYGSLSLNMLTGSGFLVSVVIGGFGAMVLFGALLAIFPNATFFLMVIVYFALGVTLSVSLGLSGGTTLLVALIAAGCGWAANVGLAQEANAAKAENAEKLAKLEFERNPTKGMLKDKNAADIYALAEQVFETRFINDAEYEEICAKIAEYAIAVPDSARAKAAGDIPWRKPDAVTEDDKAAFDLLHDFSLITETDWITIGEDMDAQIEKNAAQAKAAQAKAGLPEALADLAGCKAISMKTYLRAMLTIDPDYPPTAAKFDNLSTWGPSPKAKDHAKLLFQRQLIDVEEYQAAYQKIEDFHA